MRPGAKIISVLLIINILSMLCELDFETKIHCSFFFLMLCESTLSYGWFVLIFSFSLTSLYSVRVYITKISTNEILHNRLINN